MDALRQRLEKRALFGNLRTLSQNQGLIDFASNDYLGLAKSTKLHAKMHQNWEAYHLGLGSTGSRLLTGNSPEHEKLERQIASFHGYEEALLFGTGYMANIGLISAVAQKQDAIIYDVEVHASIKDGVRLSSAVGYPFRHNDLEHLEKRLKQTNSARNRYICIESVYSTDGSVAPLVEICRLSKLYAAHVILDEAHAIGILGPEGRGLAAQEGVNESIFALVATFGKALGVYGAVVLGSRLLKLSLINFANSAIYTTAMPFYHLAAIQSSYELFPKMEMERWHVATLVKQFQDNFPGESETHIQACEIKGNQEAHAMSNKLLDLGMDVRALLSPTVRRGKERLRICLHAFNTEEQVCELCQILQSK